jgi:hypothetical protein
VRAGTGGLRQTLSLAKVARGNPQTLPGWVVAAAGLAIVTGMSRIERLTERAINFAITEADENLAVARLAVLAQGDHAALDAAIDACLTRTERMLYTRWRAIGFLARSGTRTSRPGAAGHLPAPAAPTVARVGPRGAPGARGETTSQAKTAAGR